MQDNPNLARQIFQDLIRIGKLPLFLLFLTLLSALAVVLITQKTRTAIARHDQLLMERETLDVEWRNQLLEEHALSEHSRVDTMAREELQMIRPDNKHEVIVSN